MRTGVHKKRIDTHIFTAVQFETELKQCGLVSRRIPLVRAVIITVHRNLGYVGLDYFLCCSSKTSTANG